MRTVVALGSGVTLALWLYTGYTFQDSIQAVQRDSGEVAARYARTQELLQTVRAQVLMTSVSVRDALLNPRLDVLAGTRQQIEASNRYITVALADYARIKGSMPDTSQIDHLRKEAQDFHATSMSVLNTTVTSPREIGDVLARHLGPRRAATLAISEEIQRLNRDAFIQQQSEISEIHRFAERRSRRQLGIALTVGFGTLLLTSLYAGGLEGRLRRQMAQDLRMARELQGTAGKVIAALEEERRTIARELRNDVVQVLTAIRLELDSAQRAIESGMASVETLTDVQAITGEALQTATNLSQLLHPSALDDLGLPAAIEASLCGLTRRHHIHAELQQTNLPERLPREVELVAYRIAQEAITNVGKHSRAMRCLVRLTQLTDRLLVEVEDDGIGFVEDIDRSIVARGVGLSAARERATRLGGTFNILTTPGQGTRVIVSLPDRAAMSGSTANVGG